MDPNLYHDNLTKFMNKHVNYNKRRWNIRLQSFNSLVCGCYIIYLIHLIKKYDDISLGLRALKSMFHSKSYFENDVKLVKIVYRLFKSLPNCKKMLCDNTILEEKYCKRIC